MPGGAYLLDLDFPPFCFCLPFQALALVLTLGLDLPPLPAFHHFINAHYAGPTWWQSGYQQAQ